MTDSAQPEALRQVFANYGLAEPGADLIDALIEHSKRMKSAAARARRTKRHPRYSPPLPQPDAIGWPAEDRIAALNHISALLRYADDPPRNPETPRRRRQQLLQLLDRLPVAILLKATRTESNTLLDYDVGPLLAGLRHGRPRRAHLEGLARAIEALGAPRRTGRRPAPYAALIRGSMIGWSENGGGPITASLSYPAEELSKLGGNFASFLHEVFKALDVAWPGNEAVHQQVLKLKNEESFLLGP